MESRPTMRILRKKDLFLLAGVFLAGLLILAFCFSTVSDGQTVNICVDGKTVAKLPLAVDCEYLVNGYRGGHNLIQIKDGIVTITEADCPNQLCVMTPSIRHSGFAIVCLPHRVSVEIESKASSEIDIIAGGVQ